MYQGRFFTVNGSRVVQRQVLGAGTQALRTHSRSRHHRWLISFAFMIAVAASSGLATAGPVIVPAHDTGGGGGLLEEVGAGSAFTQDSGYVEDVDGFTVAMQRPVAQESSQEFAEQDIIAESRIEFDQVTLANEAEPVPAHPGICPPCREP